MRGIISFLLIVVGIAIFLYFGYNILTLLLIILFCFIGGIVASVPQTRSQRDSDNINTIATIERNRYFRKQD